MGVSTAGIRTASFCGRRLGAAVLTAAMLLGPVSCATPPKDPAARAEFERRNDPLEPFNRKVHDFNVWADRNIGRPLAKSWTDNVPKFIRDRVRTFADHLNEPITFINDVLQGEQERAAETAVRFWFNTVAGVGGMFDVAAMYGLKRHTEDFGQTLAVWGLPSGPYLVLPILGPSSPRAVVGMIVDGVIDPVSYATGKTVPTRIIFGVLGPVGGLDFYSRQVEQLKAIEKNSLDYYAALRSFYRQNRRAQILNGRGQTKNIPLPGEDEDDEPPATPKAPAKTTN